MSACACTLDAIITVTTYWSFEVVHDAANVDPKVVEVQYPWQVDRLDGAYRVMGFPLFSNPPTVDEVDVAHRLYEEWWSNGETLHSI